MTAALFETTLYQCNPEINAERKIQYLMILYFSNNVNKDSVWRFEAVEGLVLAKLAGNE